MKIHNKDRMRKTTLFIMLLYGVMLGQSDIDNAVKYNKR